MSLAEALIKDIESLAYLNSRYENLQCLNIEEGKERKGQFSVIFSAKDIENENENVIIKFLDPSTQDPYRIESFKREEKILEGLLGKNRCAQLVAKINQHQLLLKVESAGTTIPFDCKYFTLKWYPLAIDQFFLGKNDLAIVDKLLLFHKILLSVQAIHRHGVIHRDLKADNFRGEEIKEGIDVSVIDFGTAMDQNIKRLLQKYDGPVGHLWYASPESYCGLSGCRDIAQYSDFFALGAMFYELFNKKEFMTEYLNKKNNGKLQILASQIIPLENEKQKITKWESLAPKISRDVEYPDLLQNSKGIPPAIAFEMKTIFRSLVEFDFNKREKDLNRIRSKILICAKILKNEKLQKFELERKCKWRERGIEKKLLREERIRALLKGGK